MLDEPASPRRMSCNSSVVNKSFFDSLCGDSLVDAEELESRGLDAEAMCSPLGLTLTPAGAEEDHHPASLIWNRNGRAGDSLDHKLPIFVAPVTPAASSAAHNAASNASDLERTLPPPHAELVRPIISQPASPGISAAASAMGTMAVLAPKDANDPTDAVSAAAANVRRGLPDAIVPPASNALCASSLLVAPAAAAAATLPLTAPASAAGLPTRNLQAPAEAAESQLLHLAAVSQVKHLVPLRLRCSLFAVLRLITSSERLRRRRTVRLSGSSSTALARRKLTVCRRHSQRLLSAPSTAFLRRRARLF